MSPNLLPKKIMKIVTDERRAKDSFSVSFHIPGAVHTRNGQVKQPSLTLLTSGHFYQLKRMLSFMSRPPFLILPLTSVTMDLPIPEIS